MFPKKNIFYSVPEISQSFLPFILMLSLHADNENEKGYRREEKKSSIAKRP
jgi:hypothetical protein